MAPNEPFATQRQLTLKVVVVPGAIFGAEVRNCSFVNCSATDYGGAICSLVYICVRDCSFVNCSAYRGGAIDVSGGSVGNCSFVGCSASKGGAISVVESEVIGCSFICFFIIVWGLKGITKFTSSLVPIMGLVYMGVCLFVIITNISSVPTLLLNIIKQAFNFKALGWGIFSSMIIGVQRGIFSSESGIGTGAVASGTSDTNSPIKQGFLQMLGVYFTTFIVCTSTALIIMLI